MDLSNLKSRRYDINKLVEAAQEASLKMMKRGQHIHSVHEEKLLNKPEILEIRREGTP